LPLANMTADDILQFMLTFAGKYISKKARKSVLGGIDYNADAIRWAMDLRDNPMEDWTIKHWLWARKQVLTIKKLKRLKTPLRINAQPTSKLLQLQVWGHDPYVKKSPPHEFDPPEPEDTDEAYDGRSGPRFAALKKHKVPLTDAERAEVLKRKAVWHHGPQGAPSPAVFKSVMPDGRTWYTTHTHRAYNVTPTLAGTIERYHQFIKSTA